MYIDICHKFQSYVLKTPPTEKCYKIFVPSQYFVLSLISPLPIISCLSQNIEFSIYPRNRWNESINSTYLEYDDSCSVQMSEKAGRCND